MQAVIMTRERPQNMRRVLPMFPQATVCIAESEETAYRQTVPADQLLLHPDSVSGIGPLRHWILQNVQDRIVIMIADDIGELAILTGLRRRLTRDAGTIWNVMLQTAQCADDAGCSLFGFNRFDDVRKYKSFRPFTLRAWSDGVVGQIGRRIMPDPNLKLRGDYDWWLRAMAKDRIVWIDTRFAFMHPRFTGAGGNSSNRSEVLEREEIAYLKRIWGDAIKVSSLKSKGRQVHLLV